MKETLLKLCRWVLLIMGLSATAASCRVEYGTPYIEYDVKGKVVDKETGDIVKGVKVTPGYAYVYKNEDGIETDGFTPFLPEQDVTDGTFRLGSRKFVFEGGYDELHIRLTDPDPSADGHYKDSIYVVPLERKGDGPKKENWNDGIFGADITIEAEKAE